jgi:hypothetical protein
MMATKTWYVEHDKKEIWESKDPANLRDVLCMLEMEKVLDHNVWLEYFYFHKYPGITHQDLGVCIKTREDGSLCEVLRDRFDFPEEYAAIK